MLVVVESARARDAVAEEVHLVRSTWSRHSLRKSSIRSRSRAHRGTNGEFEMRLDCRASWVARKSSPCVRAAF